MTVKLDVTGMGIDEITKAINEKVGAIRKDGWHYSGACPVNWLLESGEPKKYIVLVFAKRDR